MQQIAKVLLSFLLCVSQVNPLIVLGQEETTENREDQTEGDSNSVSDEENLSENEEQIPPPDNIENEETVLNQEFPGNPENIPEEIVFQEENINENTEINQDTTEIVEIDDTSDSNSVIVSEMETPVRVIISAPKELISSRENINFDTGSEVIVSVFEKMNNYVSENTTSNSIEIITEENNQEEIINEEIINNTGIVDMSDSESEDLNELNENSITNENEKENQSESIVDVSSSDEELSENENEVSDNFGVSQVAENETNETNENVIINNDDTEKFTNEVGEVTLKPLFEENENNDENSNLENTIEDNNTENIIIEETTDSSNTNDEIDEVSNDNNRVVYLGSFDDVYLLQYPNMESALEAVDYYNQYGNFASLDTMVFINQTDEVTPEEEVVSETEMDLYSNPLSELENAVDNLGTVYEVQETEPVENSQSIVDVEPSTKSPDRIAVIDTGSNYTDYPVVSMLGDSGADVNGHGTRMIDYILEEDPSADIIAIKALGDDGKGDISAVYAGMMYAIEAGVDTINMSFNAFSTSENAVLKDAVVKANDAGIKVVASAGNNGIDAKYFTPSGIDEAIVIGSAIQNEDTVTKQSFSNYGETVDYYVLSDSTSEGTARFSGLLSSIGADEINDSVNTDKVYVLNEIYEFVKENLEEVDQTNDFKISGPENKTFYIEAVEDTTITLTKVGSPTVGTATYGINSATASTSYTYGQTISLDSGQKCYWKITKTTNTLSDKNYLNFTSTGKINAGGNLSSLIGGSSSTTLPRYYCFAYLFKNCTNLVDASSLRFASITSLNGKQACFQGMFYGCTSLTSAPELPATTLTSHCYDQMFSGCSSLTTLPELPATTLATYCYSKMFNGCRNIKISETQTGIYQKPYRIPTTGTGTTASNALTNMFANTGGTYTSTPSINTTYYLPLTEFYIEAVETTTITLSQVGSPTVGTAKYGINTYASNSYTYGRTISLNPGQKCYWKITKPDSPSITDTKYLKFTSTGRIKAGGNISSLNGDSSTISSSYYFYGLFFECDKLVDASSIQFASITTLKLSSYESMFQGCTSLTSAPTLPTTTLADYCYESMFQGCTSLVTAPALPAINLKTGCYSKMFKDCTSIETAPSISATSTDEYCCTNMFSGCTSLVTPPVLQSTTATTYCYS